MTDRRCDGAHVAGSGAHVAGSGAHVAGSGAATPLGSGAAGAREAGTPVTRVDPALAEIFDWGSIHWLCSGELMPDAKITVGHVSFAAGQKNPRHYHPTSDEVLLVLEGELDHTLGGATHRLSAGMAIYIAAGVEHDATNRSAHVARAIVVFPTGTREVVFV